MRHALSATLLGWAALAHATTPKNADDAQWTRVDLDNAPALVVGASLNTAKSAKAGAQAAKKAAISKDEGAKDAKQTEIREPQAKESKAVSTVSGSMAAVTYEPMKTETQTSAIEPAQLVKAPTAAIEPAQLVKAPAQVVLNEPQKELKLPAPAVVAPRSPVSAIAALVAPALQLLPKTNSAAPQPISASVEPAQSVQVVKKPVPLPEAPKPAPTFALSPKDKTIRAGLERWTASAGWKLSWELDEKFQSGGVVRFDADFGADFDSALSKLAGAMRSEVKTHAYLYVGNKVLRIIEEPAKPVVQPAVPMTPSIPDGAQRDLGDRGLPHVTRVKGYWLGASGTESEEAPPESLPPVFNASVSLLFTDKASLGTVTGILSKVTGITVLLPGAIEYPAESLFVNDAPTQGPKTKPSQAKNKRTYVGTPRALLDRISVSTGMLWEYKDETIVFTE